MKPIIGLIYDFDHTLSFDDMQNFSLIPNLGMTSESFWNEADELTEKENMEKILSYMYLMVKLCKEKGIKLTKEYLNNMGKDLRFFEGVTTWFKRINQYGESKGVAVEHYLLTSGNKEIVDGSSIAKEFKAIYGCEYLYDEAGEACWPKMAINYTSKTQYLFRISKGTFDLVDDSSVNKRISDKHIPFTNMVYIGDGLTDVPCMVLVKEKGGRAIAIHSKGDKAKAISLVDDGRVNYVCSADYKQNSNLEKVIKLIIDSIAVSYELSKKEPKL